MSEIVCMRKEDVKARRMTLKNVPYGHSFEHNGDVYTKAGLNEWEKALLEVMAKGRGACVVFNECEKLIVCLTDDIEVNLVRGKLEWEY